MFSEIYVYLKASITDFFMHCPWGHSLSDQKTADTTFESHYFSERQWKDRLFRIAKGIWHRPDMKLKAGVWYDLQSYFSVSLCILEGQSHYAISDYTNVLWIDWWFPVLVK